MASPACTSATPRRPAAQTPWPCPSRVAGAKEALHRLLAQLERRARATAPHGLLRPLVDHGQDRVRIILVELDIEIRAQPLPGLAGAGDRAMEPRAQRVLVPAQHVHGPLQQRREAGVIE